MTTVLGPEDKDRFLSKLNPRKLLDLGADILATRGHTRIKITDGTGDGQRDILSHTPEGKHHLTQSKFHADFSKAVSSTEIGEVIMGMVRFGYTNGLFITTGRISPLAKRDLTNSYPTYDVDYLEGQEIVKEVFGNLVLKAIWYDGQSIDSVSYSLVFPVIARDLERDKPLPILDRGHQLFQAGSISAGQTHANVALQRCLVNTSVFGEYRSPSIRTVSEAGGGSIHPTEAVLSGAINLSEIDEIRDAIAHKLIGRLEQVHPSISHFAVLIGMPSLTPLGGEHLGVRLVISNCSPKTFVFHEGTTQDELDWLCPDPQQKWSLPKRMGSSQVEWLRWYNPEIDACLDLTIESSPSEANKWWHQLGLITIENYWKQSTFALVPGELHQRWNETGLPKPTSSYEWQTGQVLAAWLHPHLQSPVMPLSIESDFEPSGDFSLFASPAEIQQTHQRLAQDVVSIGGTLVDPVRARHIVAIVDEDPFPDFNISLYRADKFMFGNRLVPSPIDPLSRGIRIDVCWRVTHTDISPETVRNTLSAVVSSPASGSGSPSSFRAELDADVCGNSTYILASIHYSFELGEASTQAILDQTMPSLVATIDSLEAQISSSFPVTRATAEYWLYELGILFTLKN